jgi:hypothetical protein
LPAASKIPSSSFYTVSCKSTSAYSVQVHKQLFLAEILPACSVSDKVGKLSECAKLQSLFLYNIYISLSAEHELAGPCQLSASERQRLTSSFWQWLGDQQIESIKLLHLFVS